MRAPFETVGTVAAAGAVNVLYGSAGRLTGAGSQLFTQDVAGIGGTVETSDAFGYALAVSDLDHDGFADAAVGVPFETVGSAAAAGAVNVVYGSAGGLAGAGSQLFTQDTPGIGDTPEANDAFGYTLAASGVGAPD